MYLLTEYTSLEGGTLGPTVPPPTVTVLGILPLLHEQKQLHHDLDHGQDVVQETRATGVRTWRQSRGAGIIIISRDMSSRSLVEAAGRRDVSTAGLCPPGANWDECTLCNCVSGCSCSCTCNGKICQAQFTDQKYSHQPEEAQGVQLSSSCGEIF